MQGLSSSALGAPVETEAASVAVEQRDGAPEARRNEGAGERNDATQPGLINACGLHDIRICWPSVAWFPTALRTWNYRVAGHKGFVDLRQKNLHKTGPETKKLIVQQALSTEDMDQEQFLTKIRERLDRCVWGS